MEKDQELKHACKFCNKKFHSGRSLGGHMRTHLISSTEPDEKGHYGKKLPPLTSREFKNEKKRIDHSNDSSNVGYSLRENPKKTNKFAKSGEDDDLLQIMICKECGRSFQSWKALFGHMKCHSEKGLNNPGAGEDSNQKEITDSQSDNETSAMNRKKISRRTKKRSENLSVFNASSSSPCVSDIDQEPEEAAMSLLLLSRDYGIPGNFSKMITSEVQENNISENCRAKRKCIDLHDPRKQGNSEAETEFSEGFERKKSFECISCNKKFHSFQALGGHRASHRRIKGCFSSKIDSSENSTETELSPNQTDPSSKIINIFKEKSTKVHECPICFKAFSSGQALGGHKRSHLIAESKSNQSIVIEKSTKEERDFLDLNFPPPDEEESNELVGFQKWWVQSRHNQEQLVGML